MGSLVGGWDSHAHTLDPKSVANERNRPFTKEEIEAYWRSHKKTDDNSKDHQMEVNNDKIRERSKSLPPLNTKKDWMKKEEADPETKLQQLLMKKAWGKRSNWAFLNEPPVLDGNSKTKI